MADDKKTDDYTIEMDKLDQGNKTFEPPAPAPAPRSAPMSSLNNSPILPVLAYCGSSILMTVMNKYVLSGDFNLNFFLLCVQVWTASHWLWNDVSYTCHSLLFASLPFRPANRRVLSRIEILIRMKHGNVSDCGAMLSTALVR